MRFSSNSPAENTVLHSVRRAFSVSRFPFESCFLALAAEHGCGILISSSADNNSYFYGLGVSEMGQHKYAADISRTTYSIIRPFRVFIVHRGFQMTDYSALVASCGALFQGIQHGPRQSLILFADPESRTTLAVPESEFSCEAISRKLSESRERMDA